MPRCLLVLHAARGRCRAGPASTSHSTSQLAWPQHYIPQHAELARCSPAGTPAGKVLSVSHRPVGTHTHTHTLQVYNIDQWPEMQHKRTLRENARRQYHKERAAARAQRAGRCSCGKGCLGCLGCGGGGSGNDGPGLPVRQSMNGGEEGGEAGGSEAALAGEGSSQAALAAGLSQRGAAVTAGTARRRHWAVAGLGCCGGRHTPADAAGSEDEDAAPGSAPVSQRRLERQSSVRFSPAYYSYLAWKVDRIAFLLLLLIYCLAIILIFVLQHGPVSVPGY